MKPAHYIIWIIDDIMCNAGLVACEDNHFNIIKQIELNMDDFVSLKEMKSAIDNLLGITHADADAICIASAGEYNGYELILNKKNTNEPLYPLHVQQLAQEEHWPNLFVVNNYIPIICRTFIDDDRDIKVINTGQPSKIGRRVALGIDNGLGLRDAVLLPNGQIWIGANETGRIGLSHPPLYQVCETLQHQELINFLQHHESINSEPITFETILSKKGLTLLHQFAEKLPQALSTEETFAIIAKDPVSPALQIFARYFGLFINMIELSFMPSGGIWVDGKIVETFNLLEPPLLNFVLRGRDLSPSSIIRDQFPIKILQRQDHAFLGAGFYICHILQSHIWH